jgi:hypothetical protein
VIALDTSVLIDSLTGSKRSSPELRHLIEIGQRILVPALVFYEWLRGPRLPEELAAQEALFPGKAAIVFGMEEAILSSRIYRSVKPPRRLRQCPWRRPLDTEYRRLRRYPQPHPVPPAEVVRAEGAKKLKADR